MSVPPPWVWRAQAGTDAHRWLVEEASLVRCGTGKTNGAFSAGLGTDGESDADAPTHVVVGQEERGKGDAEEEGDEDLAGNTPTCGLRELQLGGRGYARVCCWKDVDTRYANGKYSGAWAAVPQS